MTTIDDFFTNIIGFTYDSSPTLFIFYGLFIFWFMYQLFGLIYRAFGVK